MTILQSGEWKSPIVRDKIEKVGRLVRHASSLVYPGISRMDRTTLTEAIKVSPVRITMNDGSQYEITSSQIAVVDEIAVHVLYRDAERKYRTRILALVCMVSIEPLEKITS